jgi:hypothetical protein
LVFAVAPQRRISMHAAKERNFTRGAAATLQRTTIGGAHVVDHTVIHR